LNLARFERLVWRGQGPGKWRHLRALAHCSTPLGVAGIDLLRWRASGKEHFFFLYSKDDV